MQATTTDGLMRALRFSPDDLAANRAGQLSEVQLYHLRVRRRQSIAIGLGMMLFFVITATLLIFMGSRSGSPILTLIGIGVTLGTAAIGGIFARFWFRLGADIAGGRVFSITGPLERVVKPVSRRVMNYMIRVGEVEVFISKEAFDVFEHQQIYTLYRAPYTGTLLAAERVE